MLRPQKLLRNRANDKASRNGSSHRLLRGRSSQRAIAAAEAQRSSSVIPTAPQAAGPDPKREAASAVIITVCVVIEPAKPAGAIKNVVRAQRSSCRHNPASEVSVTLLSTI